MTPFRKLIMTVLVLLLALPVLSAAQVHPTARLAFFSIECDSDIVAELALSQQFEHRIYNYTNACDGRVAGYYAGTPLGAARRAWQFPVLADGKLLNETYTLTLRSLTTGVSKQCSVSNVAEINCHFVAVPGGGFPSGATFHIAID